MAEVASKTISTSSNCGSLSRIELAERGTQVTGLFVGSTDTDMMAGFDVERNRPEDVVRTALDGLEAGLLEVLADEASINVKAALALDPAILYPGAVRSA